jgi:hypothetical protein
MRRATCCLLAALLITHSFWVRLARAQEPSRPARSASSTNKDILLRDGTAVELELRSAISSETAKKGDVVDFRVLRPVLIEGNVVIPEDAAARGYVAEALKRRSWGRPGKLEIRLKDVTCADGNRAAIRATKRAEGNGRTGKVTTAVVISGVFFFPVAPLWGFVKGTKIEVPAGTRFQAFVQGDSTVNVSIEAGELKPATPSASR